MPTIVWIAAAAVAGVAPTLWWALSGPRTTAAPQAVRRNLNAGHGHTDLRAAMLQKTASERVVYPFVGRMADRARRLSPRSSVEALQRRLDVAGKADSWSVDQAFAAKLLAGGFVGLLALLTVVSSPDILVLLVGALLTVGAFWFPDFYLHNRGVERQRVIGLELPDTLDQMTISVEAGLGLEAAMARIARQGDGPIAEEFARTLQDIQLGRSRRAALEGLLDRTNVKDLRHFVLALTQADKLGVPLATTLRAQAGDMRVKRKLRAEEQAAKLPVKLVFPLIFCIMPSLFVVIMAPPIIDVLESGIFQSI